MPYEGSSLRTNGSTEGWDDKKWGNWYQNSTADGNLLVYDNDGLSAFAYHSDSFGFIDGYVESSDD